MGLADRLQAMILITTCPACQTQFEVNDAQLQAHAGQVRCGACEQVFDARPALQAVDAEQDLSVEAPALTIEEIVLQPYAPLAPDTAVPPSGLDAVEDLLLVTDLPVDGAAEDLAAVAEAAPAEDVATEAAMAAACDTAAELSSSALATAADGLPLVPAFLQTIDPQPRVPLNRRQRIVYVVLIVILSCLLAAQGLYVSRHRLLALFPASQPWLESACHSLHCSIGLPRQIQYLVIDDADIQEQPEHAHVLVFSSVLINHGDQAQAFPDIELTLTGTGDEPLFRRRIPPVDYLPADVSPAAGIAAHQEVHVKALLAVEDKRVAGYRVAIDY